MKVALVGYGKMGKIIERIAEDRGHHVVAKLNETPNVDNLNNPDVVIEFSQPEAALQNISSALQLGIPVVSGTTGWLGQIKEAEKLSERYNTAFLYGSNFSLGVNLFFAINEKVAEMMSKFEDYRIQLEEIHHIHKKDAPSGTAISLAEGIMKNNDYFSGWKLDETSLDKIGIKAVRQDEVPGTHSILYKSDVDEIELKHVAHSRDGFALGAVIAAEWIIGKKGNFLMRDVLGF